MAWRNDMQMKSPISCTGTRSWDMKYKFSFSIFVRAHREKMSSDDGCSLAQRLPNCWSSIRKNNILMMFNQIHKNSQHHEQALLTQKSSHRPEPRISKHLDYPNTKPKVNFGIIWRKVSTRYIHFLVETRKALQWWYPSLNILNFSQHWILAFGKSHWIRPSLI